VTKKQRTVWDDLIEWGREMLEKLDEALNPEQKRKPARVAVPVPIHHPQPQADEDYPY
jgi:hypothetical protein